MRNVAPRFLATILAAALAAAAAAPQAPAEKQPWQEPYSAEECSRPDVIACWPFAKAKPLADASGNNHKLTLRGKTRIAPEAGRFGGPCLDVARIDAKPGTPAEGAFAANATALNPQGAFTIEMWIQPKPEFEGDTMAFLLDKKYYHYPKDIPRANTGYCLYLRKNRGQWQLNAYLGFGADSQGFASDLIDLEIGQWRHVAFTYDGKGQGAFYVDGMPRGGGVLEGRGPVTPSTYHLIVGDRYGSNHDSFAGYIDQVRISSRVVPIRSGRVVLGSFHFNGRTVFERMEKDIALQAKVVNDTTHPLEGATVEVRAGGQSRRVELDRLAPGEQIAVSAPVDTALRPGAYELEAVVTSADGRALTGRTFEYTIAARHTPDVMPVVMWGTGDTETLRQIGFTHDLLYADHFHNICWNNDAPTDSLRSAAFDKAAQRLNEHLANGLSCILNLSPGRRLPLNKDLVEEICRIDRKGEIYKRHNVCGLIDKIQRVCLYVGESVGATLGHFPAARAAMIHTEVRDGTAPCFHEHDLKAFRDFAGYDMPEIIQAKSGVAWAKVPGFPPDRVVPEDHPVLTWYRWFWSVGDGWNTLHSNVNDGLKKHIDNPDFWTYMDPAARAPSIWGSGGNVDIVSNWTYSYPDPIKIGQTTDELFAMADGRPGQRVMKMTQVIWYRNQTAPDLPKDETKRAQWEKDIPDAKFITIAPDHMRIAFWSKLSRPVRGIMYHGWSSLVKVPNNKHAYKYTNPHTREVLAELTRDVVRPLGPALLHIGDPAPRVALLESFAAQMFARRGTYGWGKSWEADAHLILQWAHMQPRILYDQTVERDGLEGFDILVMPGCDVIPRKVADAILAFQARGGIVVADEFLAPAIAPDIILPHYKRTKKAEDDKKALQERALALRERLAPLFKPYVDASSPDIVVRRRAQGKADYLFVVNDKRTFGDYVGHHGLVMEKGLPIEGAVRVRRQGRAHVYDLVAHQPVQTRPTDDGFDIPLELKPAEGRLYMVAPQAIANVRIAAPSNTKPGGATGFEVRVVDADGKPIDAVVPLRIDILDAQEESVEFSGFYAARPGKPATLSLDIAPNDPTGRWTVRARELASGRTTEAHFQVAD